MLRMVNETFRSGELPETFKLGLLKVIPKKGDAKKIGDWRPITLLCCGYKIVSGVVATRLEKYLMKIIGRAQKGFLKLKNIHTCTANVINCISQSWASSEPTGIMCVDFSKAFDSIEHVAIDECLKFFNFGEYMRGMVKTILNDRKARIILDCGYSDTFGIKRGTPQGDRASPFIFIICMEILLIKILLMQGEGIDCCNFILEKIRNIDIESVTAEAYADDLTVIFKMSNNSVRIILDVLLNYYRATGLEVNTNKTQLMVVGTDQWIIGETIHGIAVVDNVKLLGITIDRKLEKLGKNWERVISTMRQLCRYWANFNLSITGRVLVAKTYILSQSVYLMGVLPLPDISGDIMNNILVDFVSGTDRPIERARQFVMADIGGYDLFDLKVLDLCIKSMWIGRWKREVDFMDYSGAAIGMQAIADKIGLHNVDNTMLINATVLKSWMKFKTDYYRCGNNILDAIVFCNEALSENFNRGIEDTVFSEQRRVALNINNVECKVTELVDANGSIKSKQMVERTILRDLTWAEYFRLRVELQRIIVTFPLDMNITDDRQTLESFVSNSKKGCKRYRNIIAGKNSKLYRDTDVRQIRSINSIWGENIHAMSRNLIEINMGIWKIGSLDSEFKNFLFRWIHGKLYLNNQRARFGNENRWCTFCGILKERDLRRRGLHREDAVYMNELGLLNSENIDHLFWACRVTSSLITQFFGELLETPQEIISKSKFFEGWEEYKHDATRWIIIVISFVKYFIYSCSRRKIIPMLTGLREEFRWLTYSLGRKKRWRTMILDNRRLLNGITE
jgi:hypothetical protein